MRGRDTTKPATPLFQDCRSPVNRTLSVYLDLVRFVAALLVFMNHAQHPELNGAWLQALGAYGREAVMIFFVLSGYVIAHVSATKERDARDYAISRLARLYSVVLPALVLTVIADQIGRALDPALYAGDWYVDSHPVPRFLANLLFVNEYWNQSVRAFSNGPFWSMSYEASYYVIFGLWVYSAPRWRAILVPLALLAVGPKIVLLFPVWLLGVGVYRLNERWTAPPVLAWLLFVGSFIAFFALAELHFAKWSLELSVRWLGKEIVMDSLHYSKFFLNGYVVGLLVAANFIGVNGLRDVFAGVCAVLERPVRAAAGLTFSIYLFHYPLLHLFRAITASSVLICALTLAAIALLGTYTEQRKSAYKDFFSTLSLVFGASLATRRRS